MSEYVHWNVFLRVLVCGENIRQCYLVCLRDKIGCETLMGFEVKGRSTTEKWRRVKGLAT